MNTIDKCEFSLPCRRRGKFFTNKTEAGEIYHAYSAYCRGGEQVLGIYGILDGMPKGRNERGP
jgi:predicted dithiol-disulfide oxidoreductase (DUF899 family)